MTTGKAQPRPQHPSLPMVEQLAQLEGMERHRQEALNALIGERVMHILGEPDDLVIVSTRPLWGPYYRVNVFVGPDVASARVANSYFLTVDGDGNITASAPKLTKQY